MCRVTATFTKQTMRDIPNFGFRSKFQCSKRPSQSLSVKCK